LEVDVDLYIMVIFSYGRELAAAAATADPLLGHSIGPVPGYGVSSSYTQTLS